MSIKFNNDHERILWMSIVKKFAEPGENSNMAARRADYYVKEMRTREKSCDDSAVDPDLNL